MRKHKEKKPYAILEGILVADAAAEGKCIARLDDMVVFVEGAVPGDVVDVEVFKKKKSYMETKVVKLVKPSEQREEPFCEHFGVCGGCKWQNLQYKYQLIYKQRQVVDCLTRLGKIELPEITAILGSKQTQFYRNKLEYTFSNKRWLKYEEIDKASRGDIENMNALGFHIPGRFDKILDIETCYLQEEPSNSIRLAIRAYALKHNLSFFDLRDQQGLLRNLIIRTSSTGELMVIMVFHHHDEQAVAGLMEHINTQFPQITSLLYIINSKRNDTIQDQEIITYKGCDYILEQMGDLKFKIGPKSFYQTNSEQAHELYKIAAQLANIQAHETVYDLYTGTGTIANFVAHRAKKVVGVEYVPEAIEDAHENSKLNGITNTVFYAGDMKDVLSDSFVQENGHPDVIITDPPRVGMHENVVKKLLELKAQRIVYVSCNPATQARDLQLLDEAYKCMSVQPVDMFPHTHHVENVVLLELRNKE